MPAAAEWFDLNERVAVITGGAGLLGPKHAEAIAAAGGTPVIVDIAHESAEREAARVAERFGVPALACATDVTQEEQVRELLRTILDRFGRVDILINNAASNPKVESGAHGDWSRLER